MCLRTSASTPINSFFLQHGRPLRHPSSWSSSHTEPDNSLWSFWRPKQSRSELGPLQRPQNQDQMTAGLKDCYLQNRHLTSVFSTWTPFALCVHWKKKKKKSPLLLFECLRSDRSMTMRLQRGCGLQQQGGKRTGRVQRKDRKKIHRVRASSTVVSGRQRWTPWIQMFVGPLLGQIQSRDQTSVTLNVIPDNFIELKEQPSEQYGSVSIFM